MTQNGHLEITLQLLKVYYQQVIAKRTKFEKEYESRMNRYTSSKLNFFNLILDANRHNIQSNQMRKVAKVENKFRASTRAEDKFPPVTIEDLKTFDESVPEGSKSNAPPKIKKNAVLAFSTEFPIKSGSKSK